MFAKESYHFSICAVSLKSCEALWLINEFSDFSKREMKYSW